MAMFELRTLRDVIRALPEEFRRRFAREIASGHGYPGLRIDVVAAWPRIQALDVETATRDDVIAAFGSPVAESWVYFDCEACKKQVDAIAIIEVYSCLLYTSPSPRDRQKSRMP